MIEELRTLDEDEAEDVLSEVVSRLLPNPENGTEEKTPFRKRTNEVIAAVEKYIQKGGTHARNEVLDFASNRLSSLYLPERSIDEVRARLGTRGELPLHEYNIFYQPDNLRALPLLGMRQSHIADALHSPNKIQRLTPEEFGLGKDQLPTMSLFVKYQKQTTDDPFALVVHCIHEAATLTVWQAWRVYDRDVGIRGIDAEPLNLLKAFVERYGVFFHIVATGERLKLLLYKAFSPPNEKDDPRIVEERIVDGTVFKQFFYKFNKSGGVEVVFAYIINLNPYVADLAGHGVAVDSTGASLQILGNTRTQQAFKF